MGKRILVVDDEHTIADTLTTILRAQGYESFAAYNGLLGLEAACELQPDLVLSDVMMPGMDGVSMAIEIRKAMPKIAVLLFSGQASTLDLLQRAEEQGFHFELLAKPIPPREIIRRVASTLAIPTAI
jgi:CheY-like chemotaxis protein